MTINSRPTVVPPSSGREFRFPPICRWLAPTLSAWGLFSLFFGWVFATTLFAGAELEPEDLVEPPAYNANNLCGHAQKELKLYEVKLERVVDGDTSDVIVNLWGDWLVTKRARLRLIGVDTPEKVGHTKEAGLLATEFSEKWWMKNDDHAWVRLGGFGKFGRPLAYLVDRYDSSLNVALLQSGHALYYCGGARG